MSVPSFIRIERGSDGGTALKSVNINVSMSAAPKLALVPANRHDCDIKYSYVNVCAKFH